MPATVSINHQQMDRVAAHVQHAQSHEIKLVGPGGGAPSDPVTGFARFGRGIAGVRRARHAPVPARSSPIVD